MKSLVIFGLLLAVALSFVPLFSYAQEGLVPCGVGNSSDSGYVPCGLCHLFQLITNIINRILFVFVPIIAPIFVVLGGLYLLLGRGNPETYDNGKKVLTATVVGLIIVYTAYILISTVLTFFGVLEWTGLASGGWRTICPI